ncbi:hypothetical protein GZ77_06950 [Endozoicomonas montiporae]|uniref:DNA-directed DNA polymerase family B exonuclease domain-containing protein n=1 Tax=Endozoicomonas montiporae TaxID=1027273 RepID=A0A081N6V2_9GAMM|nr:hypothetical protein [Endozoicomonas montiporae]KEQ14175.1 hypothetical protein GZ77_06950 [Endozoicomonas montiporae]
MSNTKQVVQQGFVLNRNSWDSKGHTVISLWVITDSGPARLVIEHEKPVFFIESINQNTASDVLQTEGTAHDSKPLSLTTFEHQPVTAFYFYTLDAFYRGQEHIKRNGITVLEGDIRLHERYLMERFVYGSLCFVGTPVNRQDFTEYRDVRIKPSEYRPAFKVISLDLECSAKGELYSIGLSGCQSDSGITPCVSIVVTSSDF